MKTRGMAMALHRPAPYQLPVIRLTDLLTPTREVMAQVKQAVRQVGMMAVTHAEASKQQTDVMQQFVRSGHAL